MVFVLVEVVLEPVVKEPLLAVEEPRPPTDVLEEPEREVVLVPELSPPNFLLTAATMCCLSALEHPIAGWARLVVPL